MFEESAWSSNQTDWVASFPIEVKSDSLFKDDLLGVKLLEKIKLVQKHWVEASTNKELCVCPETRHNVSNTITVKSDEWDDVEAFIFDNQQWFAGISLLSSSGDLDYAQAPFATVLTPSELVKEYGDASVFASGLVVDGLAAFEDNLWRACDTVLGYGEDLSTELIRPEYPTKKTNKELAEYFLARELFDIWFNKNDWVRRVKQFADRYFDGDVKRSTYCLKHVSLWKTWCDMKREYVELDWTVITEEHESHVDADTLGAQACSGGSCEIL
jgi:ribonucleoside-diphosphate reductase alpha chain